MEKGNKLLAKVRNGEKLSTWDQIRLTAQLSFPAMFAQLSTVAMEYIDASMVGSLGANASAAVGLVGPSTWMFFGLNGAVSIGFSVQIAQAIGAKDEKRAQKLLRVGTISALVIATVLLIIGAAVSRGLPAWLGGDADICFDAYRYFLIFSLSEYFWMMERFSASVIESTGNMKLSSAIMVLECFLDVFFNYLLIFPTRTVMLFGRSVQMPGAGLGVTGAAIGTSCSVLSGALIMTAYLFAFCPVLKKKGKDGKTGEKVGGELKEAFRIGVPYGLERCILSTAQIVFIRIIAPLGTVAVAANSLAVTAESLCYMPGYGVSSAATTMIGQSVGAGRRDITKKLGWLSTLFGMLLCTVTGILLYVLAPNMMGMLTFEPEVQALGVRILRIEAFAEPLFCASIVASGVFRGAGDSLSSTLICLGSMWLIRIPLAIVLTKTMGLAGAWVAMCAELSLRGLVFLVRLAGKRWCRQLYKQT